MLSLYLLACVFWAFVYVFFTVGHYLSSRWTDFLLEKGRRGNYAGRIVDEAPQNSPGQEASVFVLQTKKQ